MNIDEFAESILLNLPYVPNNQQVQLIVALARFCSPLMPSDAVFLLNGYAGTGKTSVTGALVRALRDARIPVVLLAPTGRAAKVFSKFAGLPATTIHRRIYRTDGTGLGFGTTEVADNNLTDGVFIVDEASMIGESQSAGDVRGSLLEDLLQYVYSGDGCRMILLGDVAQLPPVGCAESPAMNVARLKESGLRVTHAVMTEVVRQGAGSGILYNATWLRRAMRRDPLPEPQIRLKGFGDVVALPGEELQDQIERSYADAGIDDTIVITRSNRRATQFNAAIRASILGREEELCVGERLLVVKNNYLWSAKAKGLDFIANGDMAVVNRVNGTESKYGLRFADVSITMPDREVDLDCKICLDALNSDSPALGAEKAAQLLEGVINDPDRFASQTPMAYRLKASRSNPYLHALQVKYAYAVTCHKSQGGQWSDVYVDMGYVPPEAQGLDFYRWLYTSITRATGRLYLINPDIKTL